MKKHTRNLLIIIPLLPLLMGNSPAPAREEYEDFEITYLSEETLHGYNFYHFNIKNTGDGYIDYLQISNKYGDSSFYANVENSEICGPFNYGLIEPGFDREVIVLTKNKIPESKEVVGHSYNYNVIAEGITFNGSKAVEYSYGLSTPSDDYFAYEISASYEGDLDNYSYEVVAHLTYQGQNYCIEINNINHLYFSTHEQIDVDKLTINKLVMLRSKQSYEGRYYDYSNAISTLLIFLLVFGLFLGFGIFSAIFFPAMARRKRRKAALQQNNK